MQEAISFGVWLRKQRRERDLSRQAFAAQVGCAEVTLRRIEAGTLKPSKELTNILLEKLGIPDTERLGWISFARGVAGFPPSVNSSPTKPLTNLPTSLTSFIGREKELSEVIRLITKHRLVTLTGSGGVGKSRLSLRVGEQVVGHHPDGVWLVELAPILDPLLVPRTIAIAIGLRDEPQRPVIDMLSDYLREKKLLLILDNCEHLLDGCAELANTLLKRSPSLKILATSREVLGILGEATYRVPSLALPDRQQLVEKFRDYESVRLFEERAQLVQQGFLLTLENASSVVKICKQLDGIPLAIELAAAHISSFSAEQIATRLQENFSFLNTGNRTALPRHQTLQAAIDWSYDLLSPTEQTLFRRLSVFVDGWTFEAAEFICSDANIKSETILGLLSQLINKSLVAAQEKQGKTRYRMLETIRQYAHKKLIEAGEDNAVRDRHLAYFLNLAEAAEPHLIRPEQIAWLPVLDADYENLRLALEWALDKSPAERTLKLCKNLWWYWKIRCLWLEGLKWVKRALAKPSQNENINEKLARTQVLYTQAELEWQLGNFEEVLPPANESLALATEVLSRKEIAIAKFYVGNALRGVDQDQALSLIEESFAEFQALNEPFWQARSFSSLGDLLTMQARLKYDDAYLRSLELARMAGERLVLADALSVYAVWLFKVDQWDEGRKLAEESNSLYEQIGYQSPNANSFMFARIAWIEGNTQKARSLHMEMLERSNLLGDRVYRSTCLTNLGLITAEEGDLNGAQEYLEDALTLSREGGHKPFIAESLLHLGNLFYLQGNLEAFKQNVREAFSLRSHFSGAVKVFMLATILNSIYLRKPEISARLLGMIDNSEKEHVYRLGPIAKRSLIPTENHARKSLGDATFESAFAEGQKISLDEALDIALQAVEEIE